MRKYRSNTLPLWCYRHRYYHLYVGRAGAVVIVESPVAKPIARQGFHYYATHKTQATARVERVKVAQQWGKVTLDSQTSPALLILTCQARIFANDLAERLAQRQGDAPDSVAA